MTRTAPICLAALTLAVLGFTGVARATPRVVLEAEFVPIQGFPETGNVSGNGAALQTEWRINGSEYGANPPPLTGINLYLPAGTGVHPEGFPVCLNPALGLGANGCPVGSSLGPSGEASAVVPSGKDRYEEKVSVRALLASGGGELWYFKGTEPWPLEFLSTGSVRNAPAPFGPELVAPIPLVRAEDGAPDLSIERLNIQLGAAYKRGPRTISYLTVPSTCPSGGAPVKAEVSFAAEDGQPPQTITASYKMQCPHRGANIEAPLPETSLRGTGGIVTAPSNKACISRRHFTIHVRQYRGLTYREVTVYLSGRRVKVVSGARISAPIDLRGLPKGLYTVRITVTTSTGQTITGARAYHTCAPRPLGSKGNARL